MEKEAKIEENGAATQEVQPKTAGKTLQLAAILAVVLVVLVILAVVDSDDDDDDETTTNPETTLPPSVPVLPEAVTFPTQMVVTSNPLASLAGEDVLAAGGTVADAMVAVQTVLSLVEPQSCGIGGGAFVVYYDAANDTLTTFDAREKAPSAATEDRFANLGFAEAWQSGLSVGVPGVVKMMEDVHDRYGVLDWATGGLFDDAINYARVGYRLFGRTSTQVQGHLDANAGCAEEDRVRLRDPTAFEMFVDFETDENGNIISCQAKPEGAFMTNEVYAQTLEAIQAGGSDVFYSGSIAQGIVDAVQGDPRIAGDMTMEDLAAYEVIERPSVCQEYRGYDVCGMGPPSSGALAVGQILGIMENFEPNTEGQDGLPYPLNVEDVHIWTQAMRLAFADRGKYVGDSDFVEVPIAGMLNKDYLAQRAELITDQDMGTAEAGVPPGAEALNYAQTNKAKLTGTAHVSIIDQYGNALSMTTTIESSMGNGVMTGGFLLNNELTDFNFAPTDADGTPAANRVQSNKRPRSSMSPSILFESRDGGRVVTHVTGSPGGSSIIGYTAQSINNMVDYGLDPQEAINVPHYQNRNGGTALESPIEGVTLDYDIDFLDAELTSRGHVVSQGGMTSGLSVIRVDEVDGETSYVGGGDSRRDGTVAGN